MIRPLFDSEYLYGFHDPGGEDVMLGRGVPGWVLITTAIGHNPNDSSGENYSRFSNKGLGVIVRLNNGYSPQGTLPFEKDYDAFARRCANFVQASSGAHIWIIGNEPNHPIEWPGAQWDWNTFPPHPISPDTRGEPITPERYAEAYKKARAAIHAVPGHEQDQVLVAAVAPWNTLTPYPGNEQGDWIKYFIDVLTLIGPSQCDGITLHAYTHGANPDFIESEAHMSAPFDAYHWHFRAYQDFMNAIPDDMRFLPVYITESDQGDAPWHNANTGWVKRAYQEIDNWNKTHPQKIRALILYRWSRADKWHIEGKQGVIDDFAEALTLGLKWTTYDDTIDLGEYWRRLEELESQKNDIQNDIDAALQLSQTLDEELDALKECEPKLNDIEALQNELESIEKEISEMEVELAAIIPIIPPGAIKRPIIHDISDELPQHSENRWPTRKVSNIHRIVIHHTLSAPDINPAELAQQAVNQNKPGIPYHFLITADGAIYQTQPLTKLVQQNLSSNINRTINADSIAVALAGDFRRNRDIEPNETQRKSAAGLIAWLVGQQRMGSILTQIVFGRKELGERVLSPGDQWTDGIRWKDKLLKDIQTVLDESMCGDPEEIAQLREKVLSLQTEITRLQALADQVGPLQQQISDLQASIKQRDQQIAKLQSVIDQCAGPGPIRPKIIDVVDSLPHHPTLPPYTNRTEPIRKIVIHHTDTPKSMSVEQIAQYHVFGTSPNKSQWPGIGYHYVIAPDGTIYWTQRHETRSYHVGAANNYCLGVSLIGRFMKTNYDGSPRPPEDQLPTPAQMESAAKLVAWLMDAVNVPDIKNVVGHKEVGITACPGDQWLAGIRWKDALHQKILSHRANKPIELYLLFWDHGTAWAQIDWENAQNYIAHFRPTTGFKTRDAMQAQHVVIVGGPAGVSGQDEAYLRAAGCNVHRLAGANESETKALLDDLVAHDTPWPGAEPVTSRAPHTIISTRMTTTPPKPDEWTIPDQFGRSTLAIAPSGEYQRIRVETLALKSQ